MKKYISILLLSVCYPVTIDGYAYLENQTDHSGVKVLFTRTAPSSLLDSTTTATNGSYSMELEEGIYDVAYSKDAFYNGALTSQAFYSNTTLANIALLLHLTLVNIPADVSTIQGAIDISLVN